MCIWKIGEKLGVVPRKGAKLENFDKDNNKKKKRPLALKGSKWASGGTKYNEITFFCLGSKNRSSGGICLIFSPDPANFSASNRPGSEFPAFGEDPEKIKNLNLTKMK